MTGQATVRPYAAALIDVLGTGDAATAAESALQALTASIADHDELRRILESPAIAAAKKHAILDGLLDVSGGAATEVRRLVRLLVDQDQLGLLADLASAYATRLRQARNILEAEVVTVAPLGDGRRAELAAALSRAAGGTVTITERVDPTIVGGLVARVGSTVFDGSVTRQLDRLRQRLLGDA